MVWIELLRRGRLARGLEEAAGDPSSLSDCDPKRPRASGRGGETVGRHRANLMPTASYWLPSSINWRCNALQPLPAHDVSKTMKPMMLSITYLMTLMTYQLLWIRKPLLN
jgi:hypothetical protein